MIDPIIAAAQDQATQTLVTKLVSKVLSPILSLGQYASDKTVDVFGNRFESYLARQLEKHSYLPTIVFQVRKPIEDLYIPLTIVKSSDTPETTKTSEKLKISKYHPDFLPKVRKALVVDDAGMGKSTLSRFLLLRAIKTLSTVPIFIELRHLSSDKGISQVILAELNPTIVADDVQIDQRQLSRLLKSGCFTFFFDGYDEISGKHREAVTRDIKKFVESFPENAYLITSRPDSSLNSFANFQAFEIQPLQKEEAFELIRKYDCDGEKSERLIEKLNDKSLTAVHQFLKNPLLTTLLYRAYDYKNSIPLKKPVFYRQVFDALYEWHDLTKDGYSTRDKLSGLDIDGFHRVLRGLGFVCLMKDKVDGTHDEWLLRIRDSKTYCTDLRFSESNFLEDVVRAVPVLRQEGNSILWMHKSLLEYFAAQFLISDSRSDQPRICDRIIKQSNLRKFSNFLDILYDSDITAFERYFIPPILDQYDRELAHLISVFPEIPKKLLQQRAATITGIRLVSIPENYYDFAKVLKNHGKEALDDGAWRSWEAIQHNDNPSFAVEIHFLNRIQGARGASFHMLGLAQQPKVVIDILADKKHPLIIPRGLLPPLPATSRITGLRKNSTKLIGSQADAPWNSGANFEKTTLLLMHQIGTVINFEKVDSVRTDIRNCTAQSSTTSSLLEQL